MRRRLHALLVVAVATGPVLVGCTAGEDCSGSGAQCRASPEVTLSVATDDSLTYNSRGDYAGVEGTYRGERNGSRACLFIDSTSGVAKGRVNLVLPKGYSSNDSLVLIDDKQNVVVKPGDPIVAFVAPELSSALPAGCTTVGVGTARALHLERPVQQ